MSVKPIYAILWALSGIGFFACWIRSDYAKHWGFWEVSAIICVLIFLGGLAWLFLNQGPSAKKPE